MLQGVTTGDKLSISLVVWLVERKESGIPLSASHTVYMTFDGSKQARASDPAKAAYTTIAGYVRIAVGLRIH